MENRAEKLRSVLFVSGISRKFDTFRLLCHFRVILRSSGSLLCSLFPKVSENPEPELKNKPRYASNLGLIGSECWCTTDYAYRPSHHELHVLGPVTSDTREPRFNHLVKSKFKLMLSLNQNLLTRRWKNRAEKLRSVLFVSGISRKFDTFRLLCHFWVILRSSGSLLLSLFQKFPRILSPN